MITARMKSTVIRSTIIGGKLLREDGDFWLDAGNVGTHNDMRTKP